MNKLTLEMNIVGDADKKVLLKTSVSLEKLSDLVKNHGEEAVRQNLWIMFQKLVEEIKK